MTPALFTFELGGRRFGLDAARVLEVHEAVPTVPLPFAPPEVAGLGNVGGRLLPVVWPDSAAARAQTGARFLVVVAGQGGPVAVCAGRVGTAALENGAPQTFHPVAALPDRLAGAVDAGMTEEAEKALTGGPARALATVGTLSERFLLVRLAGRTVALDISGIAHVFLMEEVRPLPRPARGVRGVTRALGRPVLLVEPGGRPASVPDGTPAPAACGILVETPHGPLAIGVEWVGRVIRLPAGARRTGEHAGTGAVQVIAHQGRWLEVRTVASILEEQVDDLAQLATANGTAGFAAAPARRAVRRFLLLRVGGRAYALAFEDVRRIVERAEAQPLPGDAHGFDGIAGVDGTLVPVVDLRRVLGGDAARPAAVAVLATVRGGTVALLADEVQRVRKVSVDDVDPLADPLTAAIIPVDGGYVPVLRADGLAAPAAAAAA